MKILLVEDDQLTGATLVDLLTAQLYTVNLATDGETGLQLAQDCTYDLVLLDIVLPKLDGITLCQTLRSQGYDGSILLLTAKDSTSDRVLGLDAGADDYVVKPFDLPELLARIRALLRRSKGSPSPIITWETIQFDPINSEVTCAGKPLHLTPKEFCVLELFLYNPKRTFSRSAILDRLWDFAESPGEETVSSHIYSLRQKLKAAGSADMIETVHGLGYRLRPPSTPPSSGPDQPLPPGRSAQSPSSLEEYQQRQQQVMARTAQAWQKHKSTLTSQVLDLEQALQRLLTADAPPSVRQSAEQVAHKLVGALGLFGWSEGSRIARQLEELLQLSEPLQAEEGQWAIARIQLLHQGIDTMTVANRTGTEIVHPLPNAPLILVVDDDTAIAEQLRWDAIMLGMQVLVATDLAMAEAMIAHTPPDVILLDLNFPRSQHDGFSLLQDLTNQRPHIPVLICTARDCFSDRVEAVRLGAQGFLQKPLLPHQIFLAILEVLHPPLHVASPRILVVHQDAQFWSHFATALQPWQVEITVLDHPQQFWQVLTHVVPNLLILDRDLSPFNGLDLCRVVCQDRQWQQLPILIMTEQPDIDSIQQIFAAGADDWIPKPIVESDLIQQILGRLAVRRSPIIAAAP